MIVTTDKLTDRSIPQAMILMIRVAGVLAIINIIFLAIDIVIRLEYTNLSNY